MLIKWTVLPNEEDRMSHDWWENAHTCEKEEHTVHLKSRLLIHGNNIL